ncbi:PREDICTED: G-type lectin S-receptor-like serine/threonine-protein kinase SD2-5 [Ipomoea nil]|uniref:G-type lectin S-receptor-like serine/threonine-protein kinase SD2-5 n=1 Tax=Ipomoea nil TaxID=35883 RepID=UPI000900DD7D|nr:PREDICTED: G-type lectin S-receptor-like serine/threonine-protein kinase SD2-5 [Ipomoea nil]
MMATWHYIYYTQTQSSLRILAAAQVLLVLVVVILCSQSSLLICGQPQPLAEYNIGNSSSIISWTDSNSNYSYDANYGVGLSRVILFRQINSSTSFACGLICDYFGTTCLFGVLVSQYFYYNSPHNHQYLIWSAIQKRTVTVNASLELRRDGGLFLMESDGSLVWSTHTNTNVSGLKLTDKGNLAIFGQNNETIWQSFDYPVDVIQPRQGQVKNGRAMELIRGSISTSNYGEDGVPLSVVLLFRHGSIHYDGMFTCGLICDDFGTTCLFGVLLLQDIDIPNELNLDYQSLVWSANRNHPVTVNATVELRRDGGLVLMDSNGTVVWSTHTNGTPVLGLNLTENGNLVIFGKNYETIWQSFDHPTDTILPAAWKVMSSGLRGQTILKASISKSIFGEGLYSLYIDYDYSAYAYIRSSNAYWYQYANIEDMSNYFPNNAFIKFEPDGHLRTYGIESSDWAETADVFTPPTGFCGYPLACGKYGVCDGYNQNCNCPPDHELGFFTPVNRSQATQGCSLNTPISCEHSQLHTLLEMKNTSFIGHNVRDEFGDYTDLQSCKNRCLRDCSCKALHFYGGYSKGYCLLLNQVLSLVTMDYVGSNKSIYLKVQNSSTQLSIPKTTHPWVQQRHAKIILGTIGASMAVLVIITIYFLLVRKKTVQPEDEEEFLDGLPGFPTRFSYQDLSAMTQNFSTKLGEGGFGSVFEGALCGGTKIAVKCLKGADQIKNSFMTEVDFVLQNHRGF